MGEASILPLLSALNAEVVGNKLTGLVGSVVKGALSRKVGFGGNTKNPFRMGSARRSSPRSLRAGAR